MKGRGGDLAVPAPWAQGHSGAVGCPPPRSLPRGSLGSRGAENWGCEDVVLKEGPESLHQRMPAQGENPLQPWGHVPGRQGEGGGTWGHSPLLMYVATSSHTGR